MENRSWILVAAIYYCVLVCSVTSHDHTQDYCRTRQPEQCCSGRDDKCTVPRRDTYCYCDMFCAIHLAVDCCPDFEATCMEGPGSLEECSMGDKTTEACNKCECIQKYDPVSRSMKRTFNCTDHACLNDDVLINNINRNQHGWSARSYDRFSGLTLEDGISYFLGTHYPKSHVMKQYPMSTPKDYSPSSQFDARQKWRSLIQPAFDQGRCASSWAVSTAGVAADRWGIESRGQYRDSLSLQQLVSCSSFIMSTNPCRGGRLEDAWWYLKKDGLVSEKCYPYMSGVTEKKEICYSTCNDECPNKIAKPFTQKMTPMYRIASNERSIQYEIENNGPVQAIIKVRADFFQYDRGVYSYSAEPENPQLKGNHTLEGYHSVKLIGWGVLNGEKYWLAVNSWGQEWGDEGTFKIKRGANDSDIEKFIAAAWARLSHHDLRRLSRAANLHRRRHTLGSLVRVDNKGA